MIQRGELIGSRVDEHILHALIGMRAAALDKIVALAQIGRIGRRPDIGIGNAAEQQVLLQKIVYLNSAGTVGGTRIRCGQILWARRRDWTGRGRPR